MEANAIWLAAITIVVQSLDAIVCVGPIPYIRKDLERLNCSEAIISVIPVVKIAAVGGMILGLWLPIVGVLATAGMLAYFVVALWFHKRAADSIDKYIPAVAFMALFAATLFISYLPAI